MVWIISFFHKSEVHIYVVKSDAISIPFPLSFIILWIACIYNLLLLLSFFTSFFFLSALRLSPSSASPSTHTQRTMVCVHMCLRVVVCHTDLLSLHCCHVHDWLHHWPWRPSPWQPPGGVWHRTGSPRWLQCLLREGAKLTSPRESTLPIDAKHWARTRVHWGWGTLCVARLSILSVFFNH